MCHWILGLFVLGQGDDVGEWVNILIIVVMAIFWVIGGLVKSLTAKDRKQGGKRVLKQPSPPARTPGQKRETLLQQLARKAEEFQAAAAEQARKMERQAQGKIAPKAKPPQNSPHRPRKPRLQPQQSNPVEEPVSITPELDAPLVGSSEVGKRQEYKTSTVIDLTDPDKLRQAILHYEILGKPLSLREPFD